MLEPSSSSVGDNNYGPVSATSEKDQEKLSSKLLDERVRQAQERTRNLKLCLYTRLAEKLVEKTESIFKKIAERQEASVETTSEESSTTDALYSSIKTCLKEVEKRKELLQQVSTEQDKRAMNCLAKLQTCEVKLFRVLNDHFHMEDPKSTHDLISKKMETTEHHSSQVERRKMPRISVPIRKAADRFLRTDGTIDFVAIRASIEWLLDRMTETWERLNGRSAEQKTNGYQVSRDKRLVLDSESIKETKKRIEALEKELQDTSRAREMILRKEDALGKLKKLREIRTLDEKVDNIRKTLAIKVMLVELERVYMLLRQEVELSDDFNEQEILIAAFENADIQLARLGVFADSNVALLVSDDELGLVAANVEDVRSRLGLETDAYISGWEWNKLQTYFVDVWRKSKQGFEFYSRGTKLLGGDIIYAVKLIRRAVFGYTLSPREVRTLRRTGRDLLTLFPFTFILILPLTPVGHVLVFSFIQRYFPDFFPSTFSERRQQRMKRYEAIVSNLDDSHDEVNIEDVSKPVYSNELSKNIVSTLSQKNETEAYPVNRKPSEDPLRTLPSLDEVHLAE
ncbi:hypothetical protein Gasu2_00300 [Galdieria sulphuraria]|uniref:Letm1 RBD domain-containing protein n=1 Tax=Galdieria sulphuraria TaxID=130081 RepID=M2XTB4_GALSU|nr:uncharacterized protein Gasu_56910 [Galdieria sulphuraria]EME26684.1 hypothetical protein Gasu_56910 [Galdieria sulphuraria]GJD05569.1 hypothetical protein Gasu2_00300 [Galdieria sulphuraria]|eukprot:XP_005703204.1 hypothetical protein Gasu_56910 [Galdieria sulphuraria]